MGTHKVNLQSEGGGKKGKRQSLRGAILWCVNSTKLLLLYQGTLKPVCRKLNVQDRAKTMDVLQSVRRKAVLVAQGYKAAFSDPQTIHFQRVLKISRFICCLLINQAFTRWPMWGGKFGPLK